MRNGSGAQIISVGKAARHQHRVHTLQILGVMPEERDRLVGDFGDHVVGIVVAIGARKDQHAEFHASRLSVQVLNNSSSLANEAA
jgi:hypothetical protein